MNIRFQSFLYQFYQAEKGHRLLIKESQMISHALCKVFGDRILQIGLSSQHELMIESRIRSKFLVDEKHKFLNFEGSRLILSELDYLPFKHQTMDAVLLPHTLETVDDPYHLLRQVDKMLIGEGKLIISGYNPYGCHILRTRFGKNRSAFKSAHLMKFSRVIDWLNLLDYDIELINVSALDCLCMNDKAQSGTVSFLGTWLKKFGIEFGDIYCIRAKKRIATPVPVGLNWKLSNWLPSKKGVRVASTRSGQKNTPYKDPNEIR